MKQSNINRTAFIGALTLALWTGYPQAYAFSPVLPSAQQQSDKVTGTVSDADGALTGVTVRVKGTSTGTVTDIDGRFSLPAKAGDVLLFSYVGYATKEVKVTGNTLNVRMTTDAVNLSDVVVTALGIKRERKALGYGVSEIKGEELTKAKETNVINSLAGKVAGLIVQNTAGGASGTTRVLLRGNTEITGDNQPLYVIDGVPLDNTNFGSVSTEGGSYELKVTDEMVSKAAEDGNAFLLVGYGYTIKKVSMK